jgi:CubicO group peptidase (beta-lactamase class C family)
MTDGRAAAVKMDDALVAPPPAFGDPTRRDTLASAFGEVDRVFADFRERDRVPAVAYGVVIDDELAHHGGVGVRDVMSEAPADLDSIFRIASMTKSLTAMCVLILRDEGRLSLDDPVHAHVPELAGVPYPTLDSAPVTVRQLLSMASGLVTDDPWADRHLDAGDDKFSRWMEGGVAFTLAPGVAFEYSNFGYGILGRVVANVAGMPARTFADERVLRPLGMSSTTWDADRVPEGRVARGYRLEDDAWVAETPLADGALDMMGGLATSVRDYAKYVALHLSAWPPRDDPDEGPLRRSSLREMQQPWREGPTFMSDDAGSAAADDEGAPVPRRWLSDGYGYGLTSGAQEGLGRIVSHSGGLPGFGTHVRWLPDHGVGVMAFGNLTYVRSWNAVARAIDALAATGGLQQRVPQPAPELAAARDTALSLYERWDDHALVAAAADNVFLDLSLERRRTACAELREGCGPVVAVEAPRLSGALRGTWRVTCERGAIDVTVALSPAVPPRIQTIEFERASD